MKAVIQRVKRALVQTDGTVIGSIGAGMLILLGVAKGDTLEDMEYLAKKESAMRIFSDEEGRMNRSLSDIGGGALIVSQFTLLADTKKGNRPSFTEAAAPQEAIPLYEAFLEYFRGQNIPTEHGKFGADMEISLVNDGPVTVLLDSRAR